ncbi:MAG: hypothetical protein ACI9VR_003809 [Cognaticolwellia sp.]|jgi:hypothetical protein
MDPADALAALEVGLVSEAEQQLLHPLLHGVLEAVHLRLVVKD